MFGGSPGTQRGRSQMRAPRSTSAFLSTGYGLRGCEGARAGARRGLAYRVPERELPLTHPAEAGAE